MSYIRSKEQRWAEANKEAEGIAKRVARRATALLKESGSEAKAKASGNTVEIAGMYRARLQIKVSGSFWHEPGSLRGILGTYGRVRQFPRRKSIESWIDAMAEGVVEKYHEELAADQREKKRQDALAAVEKTLKRLQKKAGGIARVAPHMHSDAKTYEVKTFTIQVEALKDLPPDAAEAFITDLVALYEKHHD
jgi:hypothetical protein